MYTMRCGSVVAVVFLLLVFGSFLVYAGNTVTTLEASIVSGNQYLMVEAPDYIPLGVLNLTKSNVTSDVKICVNNTGSEDAVISFSFADDKFSDYIYARKVGSPSDWSTGVKLSEYGYNLSHQSFPTSTNCTWLRLDLTNYGRTIYGSENYSIDITTVAVPVS